MATYESSTVQMPHQEFGPCALVQDLLPLYLEGEVSAASSATIVEHLARCERCTAFMAGAQSVRAQLRRDSAARETVFARDEPARQALGVSQTGVQIGAVLVLCGLGAFAALLGWLSIDRHALVLMPAGMVLGLAAFGGLAALARRQAPMTLARWVVLLASSLMGALAAIFIVVPHQAVAVVIGMLLLLVALSGIWTTVFQSARPLAGQ